MRAPARLCGPAQFRDSRCADTLRDVAKEDPDPIRSASSWQRSARLAACSLERVEFELSGDFLSGQEAMQKRQEVLKDWLPEVSGRPSMAACDTYIAPRLARQYIHEKGNCEFEITPLQRADS